MKFRITLRQIVILSAFLGLVLSSPFVWSEKMDSKELGRIKKVMAVESNAMQNYLSTAESNAIEALKMNPATIEYLKDRFEAGNLAAKEKETLETIRQQIEKKGGHYYPNLYTRSRDAILYQIDVSLKNLRNATNDQDFWMALEPLAIHKIENIKLDRDGKNPDNLKSFAADLTTKESAIYNAALYIGSQAGKKVEYIIFDSFQRPSTGASGAAVSGMGAAVALLLGLTAIPLAVLHDAVKAGYAALSTDEKLLLDAVQELSTFIIRLQDLLQAQKEKKAGKESQVVKYFFNTMDRLIGPNPKMATTGIIFKETKLLPGTANEDKASFFAKLNSKFFTLGKAKAKDMFNKVCLLLFEIKTKLAQKV